MGLEVDCLYHYHSHTITNYVVEHTMMPKKPYQSFDEFVGTDEAKEIVKRVLEKHEKI